MDKSVLLKTAMLQPSCSQRHAESLVDHPSLTLFAKILLPLVSPPLHVDWDTALFAENAPCSFSPFERGLYRAMLQARPPGGDRFRIASDMFDITRAMVIAGMRAEKPQITESELRQELFLRYDGDAFSPEQRKKILAAIADSWRRKEAAQDT